MLRIHNIIKPYLNKVSLQLSSKIGNGVDGEVYNIINDSEKVIKFCALYNDTNDFNIIKYIIDHNLNDCYVKVFEYNYLGESENYKIYYYIMEKLLEISDDEKKVFHTILSHEDRGIKKNYSGQHLNKILTELSSGLDFDIKRITFFYENLKKVAIKHLDLHERNIMKDALGNYKLIDLDRCEIKIGE